MNEEEQPRHFYGEFCECKECTGLDQIEATTAWFDDMDATARLCDQEEHRFWEENAATISEVKERMRDADMP